MDTQLFKPSEKKVWTVALLRPIWSFTSLAVVLTTSAHLSPSQSYKLCWLQPHA